MKKNGYLLTAKYLLVLGGLVFALIMIWIIFDIKYFHWHISSIDLDVASKLGDCISGLVGVLWSAAGVLFIYATFKEQQKLNATQNFENTFFNLLNTYHQIVNNTSSNIGNGREFFSKVLEKVKQTRESDEFFMKLVQSEDIVESEGFMNLYRKKYPNSVFTRNNFDVDLNKKFNDIKNNLGPVTLDSEKEHFEIRSDKFIQLQYQFVYDQYQEKLGHYFRFIYNIFKYTIEERGEDARRYINLIQAQMSNDELGLLFYNALSVYARNEQKEQKFYNWLNDFNFFENIDSESLIDKKHSKFYPKNNFKFNT